MVLIDSSPAGPRRKVTAPFYLPFSDPRSEEGDFSSYSHKPHERKSGQGGDKSNRRVGGRERNAYKSRLSPKWDTYGQQAAQDACEQYKEYRPVSDLIQEQSRIHQHQHQQHQQQWDPLQQHEQEQFQKQPRHQQQRSTDDDPFNMHGMSGALPNDDRRIPVPNHSLEKPTLSRHSLALPLEAFRISKPHQPRLEHSDYPWLRGSFMRGRRHSNLVRSPANSEPCIATADRVSLPLQRPISLPNRAVGRWVSHNVPTTPPLPPLPPSPLQYQSDLEGADEVELPLHGCLMLILWNTQPSQWGAHAHVL